MKQITLISIALFLFFKINATTTIESLVESDGTLNLNTGFVGSFDVSHLNVELDSIRGVVFNPMSLLGTWLNLDDSQCSSKGTSGRVKSIAVIGTDVYVGGSFISAGCITANRIAKWNGTTWSSLGTGANDDVNSIVVNGNNIYIGGRFSIVGGISISLVAKWNIISQTWSSLGTGVDGAVVNVLKFNGSDLYVGGSFISAGGQTANKLAKWDGTNWVGYSTGFDDEVDGIEFYSGDMYVCGLFSSANGVANTNGLAKWNGSTWSALGTGTDGFVKSFILVGDNLYCTGNFNLAGGITNTYRVAKWSITNQSWTALGTGVASIGNIIASIDNKIYVRASIPGIGGYEYISVWDGSSWTALDGTYTTIYANAFFAIVPYGSDILVGGSFENLSGIVSNGIARYTTAVLSEELIDIKATLEDKTNTTSINWQLAETNKISYFEIERSSDGQKFNKLTEVKALKNKTSYEIKDNSSLEGTTYYQLKIYGDDGKSQTSKVVSVQRDNKSKIKISPSVVESELRVKYEDVNKSMNIQIVNIMGQVVYQQAHTFSNGEVVLNVSSLQAGTYFLRVDDSTVKLIKK